jgi:hypothetical protein
LVGGAKHENIFCRSGDVSRARRRRTSGRWVERRQHHGHQGSATRRQVFVIDASFVHHLWDFVSTDCPLSWYGITVYGTVDLGETWLSHGTPYSPTSAVGAEYLVQKASNRSLWSQAPNGLQNSGIGIKGDEQFAPGWSFIFDLEAGFDPYSFRLSNGPLSVAEMSGVPLKRGL